MGDPNAFVDALVQRGILMVGDIDDKRVSLWNFTTTTTPRLTSALAQGDEVHGRHAGRSGAEAARLGAL